MKQARRPTQHSRDDRGTSALEFVIVAPALLLVVFTIIQGALYFYARNTAQSASREGVSYLRLAGNNASPDSFRAGAETLAEGFASKLGRLENVDAYSTLNQDTGRVTVIVVGEVVLPLGGRVEVQQSSTATLEQFRVDDRKPS